MSKGIGHVSVRDFLKVMEKDGCGKKILVDPSDKNSESWQCGQYYDSLKKKVYCQNCSQIREASQ